MAPSAQAPTIENIQKIVHQIARQFSPEKVLLFGSHVYGTVTHNSDVDLLVVMGTTEPTLRVAATIAASVDHPFPLDIVVRTPESVAEGLADGDSFVREVLQKGVLLYKA